MTGNADLRDAATPVALASPDDGVSLWWCALAAPPERMPLLESWLSAAEVARADRFGMPALRDRYVVGRASLRAVLGTLLSMTARDVPIVRGERGRPRLECDSTLDFNVSHTAGVALIGATRAARIGVDVERLDRAINVPGIARKFLTDAERRSLADVDADSARRRVLRLWTCKEAMSKATGDALSAPFGSLDVALHEGPRLRSGPVPYEPARWTLHSAAVPAGYVATIALWKR
ncbi:MAG: 4'-phosphopantetheinyl transferase superfamily protein [Betaproteobacteria bacterium]|nr:4'-phosphopantetheinyl transferase superfamily protein [Betaproteobacteria bacterium]